jgi:type II restriction/modification system DNA methylase subunit YeeA
MNKAKLKSYASQARLDFIAAVTARANLLGLSEKAGQLEVAPAQTQGDVALIAGQAWPAKVATQREQLIARMRREGFGQTCEAVAYTWFNRFAALRYMELHDYLGHGHRALSSAEGGLPDILTYASDLAHAGDSGLPGLKAELVTELKLAGNRDGELYRMLLVAQCNALSRVMPFLFERIDDDSELLLPDNLLRSDSVIARLVVEIPEKDWTEVEIIGWLYQFYISDKKDQVIGKVVKSEDIPAATQLFTPNWIVQYLVQNSVGRLWLMANPKSTLAKDWPYYIQPAQQTLEVQTQLDTLIQTRVRVDGDTLSPESITVLDPACGSGHILVVAYDVLKSIYLERGYQPRAIPRLILEKNLFGLDIDDRAAQMAGFALLMKARADDRRLFSDSVNLNVLSLQESNSLDAKNITQSLETIVGSNDLQFERGAIASEFLAQDLFPESHLQSSLGESMPKSAENKEFKSVVAELLATFSDAKTFGSLITVQKHLSAKILGLKELIDLALQKGDLYAKSAAQDLAPLVAQAQILAMQFDAIIANPPYMGVKGMNQELKNYAKTSFPDSKSDLFSMFIERGFEWCKPTGFNSMVTMQSWMFLSSFELMREKLLRDRTFQTMAHLGSRAFTEISGDVVQTTAFVMQETHIPNFKPVFLRLVDGQEDQKNLDLRTGKHRFDTAIQEDFKEIPGSPIAYWASPAIFSLFANKKLEEYGLVRQGASTSDNNRFLRQWFEVAIDKVGFNLQDVSETRESIFKWFPYNKGGSFRKWYGNQDFLVNYENDGQELKEFQSTLNQGWTVRLKSREYYFKPAVSWPKISSALFSARLYPSGFIFDVAGCCYFPYDGIDEKLVVAYLNSSVVLSFLRFLSPTLNFELEQIKSLPFIKLEPNKFEYVNEILNISKQDWDNYETSWAFLGNPLLLTKEIKISAAFQCWSDKNKKFFDEMKRLEEKNNEIFINVYGLENEISPAIDDDQITLTQADREKDSRRLISYGIGCMMGRFSLDEPGLIYACAGNVDFDLNRYSTFPADADGIVPITDELWFDDDVSVRIREFLRAVWGPDTLEENMTWLAEGLVTNPGETSDETIRRYVADKFFKDHLQTYKKRPIYWLFSSGKHGAFQALVYLHRYNEGTLARMRAEYVVPLTSKIQSRIEMLEKDINASSSTAARNKLAKEVEKLKKKHIELLAYDDQLRHFADMRITLDLDDGVKVNYGKFGDLLAEVKTITGGAGDE